MLSNPLDAALAKALTSITDHLPDHHHRVQAVFHSYHTTAPHLQLHPSLLSQHTQGKCSHQSVVQALLERLDERPLPSLNDVDLLRILDVTIHFGWKQLNSEIGQRLLSQLKALLEDKNTKRSEETELASVRGLVCVLHLLPSLLQLPELDWLVRVAVCAPRATTRLAVLQLLGEPWCVLNEFMLGEFA